MKALEHRALARCAVREFIPNLIPSWILDLADGLDPEIATYWRLEHKKHVAWSRDQFILTGDGWSRLHRAKAEKAAQ